MHGQPEVRAASNAFSSAFLCLTLDRTCCGSGTPRPCEAISLQQISVHVDMIPGRATSKEIMQWERWPLAETDQSLGSCCCKCVSCLYPAIVTITKNAPKNIRNSENDKNNYRQLAWKENRIQKTATLKFERKTDSHKEPQKKAPEHFRTSKAETVITENSTVKQNRINKNKLFRAERTRTRAGAQDPCGIQARAVSRMS